METMQTNLVGIDYMDKKYSLYFNEKMPNLMFCIKCIT